MLNISPKFRSSVLFTSLLLLSFSVYSQAPKTAEAGSQIAKAGFKNEAEIADKFNNWQIDNDAKEWLRSMGHDLKDITAVSAANPRGEKSDVVVKISTENGETKQGISIKLVSSERGFNQIDKRWLSDYVRMWKMPENIFNALKYYCGELPPFKDSRNDKRMFINEFDKEIQNAIVEFFTENKEEIVSDMIKGRGSQASNFFMVAQRAGKGERWKIVTSDDAVSFFAEGKVEITRAGNLKIGRISMQRKGGDGGRPTANQLQFKMNPAELFDLK